MEQVLAPGRQDDHQGLARLGGQGLFVVGIGFLQVDDEQPLRHADLDRGETDAGRRVHGREHVVDQRPELGRDLLDGRGDLPKHRARSFEDRQDGHGGDVRRIACGFKKAGGA